MTSASHPYFPTNVEVLGYVENELSFTTLLGIIGTASTSVLLLSWVVTRHFRPDLSITDALTVL